MTMTTKMLNNVASLGNVYSTDAGQYGTVTPYPNFVNGVLQAQRTRDKSGLMQVKAQTGLVGSVILQGRMSPQDAWYNVLTITNTDWNADAQFSAVKLVTIFPEMRMNCNISSGTPSISAWLTE